MSTFVEKAEFVGRLSGSAVSFEKETARHQKRAETLDQLLGEGFPSTERDELRKAMTFKVKSKDGETEYESMDSRGQRQSIETEDARTRYQSIDPKDYGKVQAALEKVMAMKEKMLQAKDSEGNLLFTEADLMTELFSPLVREGLLPENLVIDKHSEVAKLLANTYKSYTKMLEEAREAKRLAQSKATVDFHRAGGKLDVLKAAGAKVKGVIDHKMGFMAEKTGMTPEEFSRFSSMCVSGLMVVPKGFKLGLGVGGLAEAIDGTAKTKDPTVSTLVGDSATTLLYGVTGGIDIATVSKDHVDSQSIGSKGNRRQALLGAAMSAALAIDQAICARLNDVEIRTLGALDGRFAKAIDTTALVDEVLLEKPQASAMVALVTTALQSTLATLVRKGDGQAAVAKTAEKLAAEFKSRVAVSPLMTGLDFETHAMEDAFDPLIEAADPAAAAAFADPAFKQALKTSIGEVMEAVSETNEALLDQLSQADEETEEFERQLVLIDEGGVDMARQSSIAVLIGQIEKDRLDLEIVNKVGTLLGSFGGSVVTLGVDSSNFKTGGTATSLATEVGQSLVPALKAAQLVMQMSVTIIQIAQRAKLAAKFAADVEKAKKAGSPMLPVIENFYASKQSQQQFAKAELALQTVQLAGAICSSVPEPITMATGKLISAFALMGSASKDFAEKVYTDEQLSQGWTKTLEALNNPKNRRAGLDALRHNGTLSVHALAWAATSERDAIALEILRSCGVQAQTLADSASDQKAVINYLETKLSEDIQFKDTDQIDLEWAPRPLSLSYAGWFTAVQRARRNATPPLSNQPAGEVGSLLKALYCLADLGAAW